MKQVGSQVMEGGVKDPQARRKNSAYKTKIIESKHEGKAHLAIVVIVRQLLHQGTQFHNTKQLRTIR